MSGINCTMSVVCRIQKKTNKIKKKIKIVKKTKVDQTFDQKNKKIKKNY